MAKLALDKILQSQGVGSRAECRALIASGAVSVGERPVTDHRTPFETEGFRFSLAGEGWTYREKVYLALNKPAGYECSRSPSAHPSILSLLPAPLERRGVQPVGRLDQDTTGLLLLSDDGAFIHAQSSPKRHVPKTYVAKTADPVGEDALSALLGGVLLRDEESPLAVRACRVLEERELEIVLDQGKYHQVKRMIAATGNRCVALRRTAIGGLRLEDLGLAEGEWRFVEPDRLIAVTPYSP